MPGGGAALAGGAAAGGATAGGASAGGTAGGAAGGAAGGFTVDPDSLRARVSPGLPFIGAAVDAAALRSDALYRDALAREHNQVVPENAMKWESLHPAPGTWTWADADALVDFAVQHQQAVHGHVLVWHLQLPGWVQGLNAQQLGTELDAHIAAVVGRYRGKVQSWDVVNEAIDDTAQLRSSVFAQQLGEPYIARAFRAARAADPTAKLFYNDYGVETVNPKSDAVYALLQRLLMQGVPIDGVGLQFHVSAYDFANFELTEQRLRDNLRRFAALGLTVHVSELDVRLAELPGAAVDKLRYQGQVYQLLADVCRSEPGCTALRTWGFTDKYSWVDAFYGADDPLPLDDALARKPAWVGLRDGLDGGAAAALDYGLDTACRGSTARLCESFEATRLPSSWFNAVGSGQVGLSTSTHARGARALEASISPSASSQALVGRTAFAGETSGSFYLRAHVFVTAAAVGAGQTLTLLGLGEAVPPYAGVSMGISGTEVQLSLTTASQYPTSGGYSFPTGSWQCVELAVSVSDFGGSASIKVGGSTVVSASGLDTRPAAGISNMLAGILYASPNHPAASVYVDELMVARTPLPCP